MAGPGSSPLSRGIQVQRSRQRRLREIIPALAGNTLAEALEGPGGEDHPRSRGEYRVHVRRIESDAGSSPLSRGILHFNSPEKDSRRIIPALAGNTAERLRSARVGRDHPRSRGEYPYPMPPTPTYEGSSPLSRGIRIAVLHLEVPRRIIPALAGNTPVAAPPRTPREDHPRSRGEYLFNYRIERGSQGSSPLSRGIRDLIKRLDRAGGIIPALAGNTKPRKPSTR